MQDRREGVGFLWQKCFLVFLVLWPNLVFSVAFVWPKLVFRCFVAEVGFLGVFCGRSLFLGVFVAEVCF